MGLLGVFLVALCAVTLSAGQILHSVSRMESALQSYTHLAEGLSDYLQMEYGRLETLKGLHFALNQLLAEACLVEETRYCMDTLLLIAELRVKAIRKPMNKTKLEETMSHPVRVLRLVTEFYNEVEDVRHVLRPPVLPEELNSTMSLLPTNEDYTNALRALGRLRHTYKGQADFTRSAETEPSDGLTAMEVFEIGRVAMEDEDMHIALDHMKRAREMFLEANDVPNAMLAYDYLAYIIHQQGNPDHALNYTYELLDYYTKQEVRDESIVERLRDNIDMYVEELGGAEEAAEAVKQLQEYYNEPATEFLHYNELCRGEKIQLPGFANQKLKCYLTTNNSPLLLLAPAKVEELSSEAGLSFYHHVISDKEINLLKKLASAKFEDSELVMDANETEAESIEDLGGLDYKVRSSNTGWVDDSEDPGVEAISRRVSAMTGLDITYAEPFQVLSYGIGGFYLPHFDYNHLDGEQVAPSSQQLEQGDRLATWIFYLNDVEKGGATVFPELGATVWPSKGGAALWYNMYRNGTGNTYTLHAACPVLQGYKWASNKWIHEAGNEFVRPCDLDASL